MVIVELRDGYWHVECEQVGLHLEVREGIEDYVRYVANGVAIALREIEDA